VFFFFFIAVALYSMIPDMNSWNEPTDTCKHSIIGRDLT